jgi:hypothetical protein
VNNGTISDIVIRERATILHLLALKDEALLSGRDA